MITRCETVAISKLSTLPVDTMWQLFNRHYRGTCREIFERDLLQKQQALLLWRGDQLTGFTSQRFAEIDGHRVTYSGDVIITPEARDIGTAHFFHHWACAVWKRCDWWCALSAGPRTFRIAHTFYRRVTPSIGSHETNTECRLRHRFAEHAYADAYCRDSGIVRLRDGYTLCEKEQCIRDNYPLDAYFRMANPGWQRGDELVSLVSLHPDNWEPVAKRMLNWKANRG
ncbi:MAG: hypothetical protein EA353_10765 [Puniceicoccaceae bacterium]|nr:MAG: hypothetical protein EA353_10765 [Puniceicoccaceae bacterium]